MSWSVGKVNLKSSKQICTFCQWFSFIALMSGAHPQSHHMEESWPVWAPSNHQQHKSCEFICCCCCCAFSPKSCNPHFICCAWFQVVYKEVERRPALGSDDLSPHNITVDSTLFNTHSKCAPSIVHDLKHRLWLEDKVISTTGFFCNMLLQTSCLHRPSNFLWSNRTPTEQTPRWGSPFWRLAQTVDI